MPIKSHLRMILRKAIVYDFFKKLLWIIKIVWKWINWRWMSRFRILDQTSHFRVQFRKRHVIHVHCMNWEWTRMTQVFCRNKLPSWKQSYHHWLCGNFLWTGRRRRTLSQLYQCSLLFSENLRTTKVLIKAWTSGA